MRLKYWPVRSWADVSRNLEQIANLTDAVGARQTPTLVNSWVTYDSARPPYYYEDRDRVFLGGVISGGASITTAFTLPAGFRPIGDVEVPVIASGGQASISILSTGAVRPVNGPASAVATWVYLDGVSFRAA
jgi:hypothetical protein